METNKAEATVTRARGGLPGTDNKVVMCPSATFLRTDGNLIRDLQIYQDVSPVFA
jgi:hypothetical protein